MPVKGQARKEWEREYYLRRKGNLSAGETEELGQLMEARKATPVRLDPFRPFQTCPNFPAFLKHVLY